MQEEAETQNPARNLRLDGMRRREPAVHVFKCHHRDRHITVRAANSKYLKPSDVTVDFAEASFLSSTLQHTSTQVTTYYNDLHLYCHQRRSHG